MSEVLDWYSRAISIIGPKTILASLHIFTFVASMIISLSLPPPPPHLPSPPEIGSPELSPLPPLLPAPASTMTTQLDITDELTSSCRIEHLLHHKVQILIGILEEIDSFYRPKMLFLKKVPKQLLHRVLPNAMPQR